MNPCVLIPVYNHANTIADVVESLEDYNLPCLIVDDGSDDGTSDRVDELTDRFEWVEGLHRDRNGGKGAALTDGFKLAQRRGYTHAVTIDADAQHDTGDVPRFLQAARELPGAMVLADPVFDDSVPNSRLYGRKISQVWVHIETLSLDISDPLVGYRCYPVDRVLTVIERYDPGLRMDFDPEVLVEFYWEYGEVVNLRTKISYSTAEGSHFNLLADNLRISYMHMMLFFGMLKRSPWLLGRSLS